MAAETRGKKTARAKRVDLMENCMVVGYGSGWLVGWVGEV